LSLLRFIACQFQNSPDLEKFHTIWDMSSQPITKILFLAANPKNSSRLRLDEELREMDEGLRRATHRDQFELEQKWAVRPKDLQRAILDFSPQIVHFSGHGLGAEGGGQSAQGMRDISVLPESELELEGLVFEDDAGQGKLVETSAIASLFELFADRIECVVLNACYSEKQAEAISQHIPYVIGMNRAIGDEAARVFAVGFYDALGAGRDIEFAFKAGCVAIQMVGIPEALTPVLKRPTRPVAPMNLSLDLEEPSGQVPLDSAFYIERPPFEARCYEAILRPGVLIRVKAPRQVGKSSLMIRVLNHAREKGYQATWLSFQQADDRVLGNLDSFLKWLCACVSHKLRLPDRVESYWQDKATLGSNDKCTYYFEEHLLETLNVPLALCLDEVDELFKHEYIAKDFLGLLRSWHEEAKISPLWRNLRLIITHSKEVYIPLNVNQSPFNVGVPIELPPFTQDQVLDLMQRHGVQLHSADLAALMELTGGHPYLIRVALYYLARQEISLPVLLKVAPTQEWFYGDHLRHHLATLQNNAKLGAAMLTVVNSTEPVRVDEAFKLASMGLVKFQGNNVVPLCGLYRQYFADMLN
jgi:AAA-like domain/CHAT domain